MSSLPKFRVVLALALGTLFLGGCNYREDYNKLSEAELFQIAAGSVNYSIVLKNVFNPNCVSCHSGSSAKAGLDLSTYATTMASGHVDAGNADDSYLYDQVKTDQMPPPGSHKPLTPGEKAVIYRWIQTGAQN